MADLSEMLKSHFMMLMYLRENKKSLTPSQWEFIDSIKENRPLDSDQSLELGQIYRDVKECETLPGKHLRGVHEVETYESCGRVG